MDDVLKRIEAKLDQVVSDITDIKVTQGKQSVVQEQQADDLKEHMKRSDHLENLYQEMQKKDIEPLKRDFDKLKGVYGFVMLLGVLASIGSFVLKAFGI